MRRILPFLPLLLLLVPRVLLAQSTYSTGFEQPTFVLGDVNGQDGWGHLGNSPTKGIVEPTPAGSPPANGAQALAVRTRDVGMFGVANHLYSPVIDPAAGESGSTFKGTAAVNPQSHFAATLWVRTPSVPVISGRPDFRFAQLNPSSRLVAPAEAGDRYANVRLINTTNDATGLVEVRTTWYSGTGAFQVVPVATLQWGTWYRFDYLIHFIDGVAPNGDPNDRFTLTIYDANGAVVGSACGSTWEVPWRSGAWGGGATPRAVNGFDFWSDVPPNDTLVATIDNMTMTAFSPAAVLTAAISGSTGACAGGTTLLSATTTLGAAPITGYAWRDGDGNLVGSAATFAASAGTYTVTVTDALCATATSAPVTVTELPPLTASISGATTVCPGATSTLTAVSAGGSGTIASIRWDEATLGLVGNGATFDAPAGTYTVTVTDASCGTITSLPFTVAELPPLVVTITGANRPQDPAPLTANVSGGSGTITSIEWRDGTGAVVGTGTEVSLPPGTYTATVTDALCGTATSAPFVLAAVPPVPAVGTAGLLALGLAIAAVALLKLR